jgi:predicted site-specific integrase-resolvase
VISTPHEDAAMAMLYMRQGELADRWGISERTLEKWRHFGRGPSFLKIGGRVMYRHDDIEKFEAEQIRTRTANRVGRSKGGAQ